MLGSGNLVEVLITALGNEIRLGDDGDGEIGHVGQAIRGHDSGVFDAVTRVSAGIAQRRDRHQQLSGGDAVDGDRATIAVPLHDPAGKLLEVQVVVMQDPFARRQAVHVLTKIAVPMQLLEPDDVGDVEIRCSVGNSGHAVATEPSAESRQAGLVAGQRIRPGVGAAQPAVRVIGQTDAGQTGRVEDPQHSAAMLDTQRNRGGYRVQGVAIQRAGYRIVVAHSADPAVGTGFGVRQRGDQSGAVAYLRRPDSDRVLRGRSGMQVHVVVMQAGQYGPACRVQHVFTAPGRQRVSDLVDVLAHPKVDDRTVQGPRPLNQHAAQDLSATSRSTAVLSAPSGDAGGTAGGRTGRSAGGAGSVDCGNAA